MLRWVTIVAAVGCTERFRRAVAGQALHVLSFIAAGFEWE
jgi:hypothetical protein